VGGDEQKRIKDTESMLTCEIILVEAAGIEPASETYRPEKPTSVASAFSFA